MEACRLLARLDGDGWLARRLFLINNVYFMLSEEPGLEKRFGESYLEYKAAVPRRLPRLRPWAGGHNLTSKE